jgi:hypothetical protein
MHPAMPELLQHDRRNIDRRVQQLKGEESRIGRADGEWDGGGLLPRQAECWLDHTHRLGRIL